MIRTDQGEAVRQQSGQSEGRLGIADGRGVTRGAEDSTHNSAIDGSDGSAAAECGVSDGDGVRNEVLVGFDKAVTLQELGNALRGLYKVSQWLPSQREYR